MSGPEEGHLKGALCLCMTVEADKKVILVLVKFDTEEGHRVDDCAGGLKPRQLTAPVTSISVAADAVTPIRSIL